MVFGRVVALLAILVGVSFPLPASADWCCRLAFERFTGLPGKMPVAGDAVDAALSPDGRHLYQGLSSGLRVLSVGTGDGRLRHVETHGTLPAAFELPTATFNARTVAVSPDGAHVYVGYQLSTYQFGIAVYRRDARSGRLLFVQRFGADTPHRVGNMVFAPDGLHLYTSYLDVRVYRRNRLTGELALLESHPQPLGLRTRGPLAISPDGRNVYLGAIQSGDDDGLVIFDRDPFSGLLDGERALLAGDAGVQGLGNPTAVVFDSSGHDVYVASRQPAVSHYTRDENGDLTFAQMLTSGEDQAPPRLFDSKTMVIGAGDTALGLLDSSGIHLFARDPVNGNLRFVESHGPDTTGAGAAIGAGVHRLLADPARQRLFLVASDGIGSLADTGLESRPRILEAGASISEGDAAAVSGIVEGLDDARTSVLSPDGRFLYVGSDGSFSDEPSTIAVFAIDPADGTFEQVQFLDGLGDLERVASLAVSGDGKHIYALANNRRSSNDDPYVGTLMVFARNRSDGTISALQTLVNEGADGAGGIVEGMQGARQVRLSPNGRNAYVVSSLTLGDPQVGNGAVSVFRRSTGSGLLEFVEVVESGTDGIEISNARAIAFSPDSRHAYVAGGGRHSFSHATDHVLSHFRRGSGGSLDLVARVPDPGIVRADLVAVSPDGRHLYAVENTGFSTIRLGVYRLHPRTGAPSLVSRHESGFAGLEHLTGTLGMGISRDGRRLVIASPDGNLVLFGRDRSSGALTVLDGAGEARWGAHTTRTFAFDPRTLAVHAVDWLTDTLTTFAPRTGPVLTAPSPPLRLTGPEAVFRWTFFAGPARGGRLLVGSTPGADDIANRSFNSRARALRVRGLPLDGRTLHVTLTSSRFADVAATFVAAMSPEPMLMAPADGEHLAPGRVRFRWDGRGHPVSRWELRIGSVEGASDLYRRRFAASTRSVNVGNLPQDGRDLFVSLLATVDGEVRTTASTHIAALPAPELRAGDGSTIEWTAHDGDDTFQLQVGTTPGASDLCDSPVLDAASEHHVCPGFPDDGRELFVTLTRTAGPLTTTHTLVIEATRPQPALVSPVAESTLDGHTVLFRFARNLHPVTGWELRVGSRRGAADLFRTKVPGDEVEVGVPGLPTLGGEVFARLFWTVGGKRRFEDYRFDAVDLDLPDLLVPGHVGYVSDTPLRFTWRNPGHDISFWRVDIGTEPGASDVRSIRAGDPADVTHTSHSAGTDTTLMVPGVLHDTNLHARWTYRIGNDRTERVRNVPLTPHPDVCCTSEAGEPLVDDTGGVEGLAWVTSTLVSPDGQHVYAVGQASKIAIFERDTDPGSAGFGALTYTGKLEVSKNLIGGLVLSADGMHLYASAHDTVYVAARDPADGSLTLLQSVGLAPTGYQNAVRLALAPDDGGGAYLYALGLTRLSVLAVAADGTLDLESTLENEADGISHLARGERIEAVSAGASRVDLYVTSRYGDLGEPASIENAPGAVLVFRHDRGAGTIGLTQEIVHGVDGVDGIRYAIGLAVDAGGEFVYVHGTYSAAGALAVFARDASTGALTHLPAFTLPPGSLRGNSNYSSLVLGPDGDRLFAIETSGLGDYVNVFDRDPITGEVASIGSGSIVVLEEESESTQDPRALAMSPDGEHLYLARQGPVSGLSAYRVDTTASAPDILQFIDVVEENEGGIDGLRNLRDLAVSPDGRHLYGVSPADNNLVILAYDPHDGALGFVEAIRPDRLPAGMDSPLSVVVSPDGAYVYVAARKPDSPSPGSGVMIFSRDAGTGSLTYLARYHAPGFEFYDTALAMSPDGRHLYRTGRNERRLEVLARAADTGLLSEIERHDDELDGLQGALDTPSGVVVSNDGRNVYVFSDYAARITSFARDPDEGTLTLLGTAHEGEGGVEGLSFVSGLAISHDGRDAYATGNGRLIHFRRRAADGLLQFVGAMDETHRNTLVFHPTSDLLYTSSPNGTSVFTRDAASGELVEGPALDGVGGSVLAVGSADMPLFAADGDSVRTLEHRQPLLLSPEPGGILGAQTTRFSWSANGVPAHGWRFTVGAASGGNDYCDSRMLPPAAREYTCRGLPRDGRPLFATVSAGSGDTAPRSLARYTAPDLALPVIANPVPGAGVSETQTFSLDRQGNDITQWRIRVGTAPGAANLFSRRFAGDVEAFTVGRLPTDRDLYVSIESRGTFGRSTTVYQFNASTAVTPYYPRAGARWGRYVRAGNDVIGGSDRACSSDTPGARESCLHGGEHRVFVVPGVLSCDGVTAEDAIGAFDWVCSEEMMPIRVISTGLKAGMRLSDLLVFAPPGILHNHVSVHHGDTSESDATAWWDNPVADAAGGGRLLDAGTIYVTGELQPLEPFLIRQREGVSLVVDPDAALTRAASPDEALVHLDRAHFAWIEGALDADGASFGIRVDRSHWTVMDGVTVTGANVAASRPFARSDSAGIAIDRSRNALLRDVTVDRIGDPLDAPSVAAGVALFRSSGSRLVDLGVSRSGTGIVLTGSSTNRLQHALLTANEADGLALEGGSRENVIADLLVSNNAGDGVVIDGRSDGNRFLQVTSRHNAGSGFLINDASLGNALVGLTATDNAMHGIEARGARRGLLASLALANNGLDGLLLSGARGNLLMDIASVHNADAGVRLEADAGNNTFRGELRVGDNGFDCVVEPGAGDLLDGCVMAGASDAALSTTTSLVGSWAGARPGDAIAHDDVENWLQFENPWWAWGSGAGFAGGFTRGPCITNDPCRVWDARLVADDTGQGGVPALAGVLPLPSADDLIRRNLRRVERFMPFARERLDDGVGDDDGWCEAGEDCLAMPNLGAYQGEGDLQHAGELDNGVRLYRHEFTTVPVPE